MEKTQAYLRKEELAALRKAAARSGCSVAQRVRKAIRRCSNRESLRLTGQELSIYFTHILYEALQ